MLTQITKKLIVRPSTIASSASASNMQEHSGDCAAKPPRLKYDAKTKYPIFAPVNCPQRVTRDGLTVGQPLLVYLQLRTCRCTGLTDAMGQQGTLRAPLSGQPPACVADCYFMPCRPSASAHSIDGAHTPLRLPLRPD